MPQTVRARIQNFLSISYQTCSDVLSPAVGEAPETVTAVKVSHMWKYFQIISGMSQLLKWKVRGAFHQCDFLTFQYSRNPWHRSIDFIKRSRFNITREKRITLFQHNSSSRIHCRFWWCIPTNLTLLYMVLCGSLKRWQLSSRKFQKALGVVARNSVPGRR